jgi:hypothetical protein
MCFVLIKKGMVENNTESWPVSVDNWAWCYVVLRLLPSFCVMLKSVMSALRSFRRSLAGCLALVCSKDPGWH